MAEKNNELKKTLRPADAVMIVVGNVIGVGIFTTTGFMAGDLPNASLIMAAWILGGVLTLLGALTYGELGAVFPKAGGDYIYLKEAYGPLAGFMVGWVVFIGNFYQLLSYTFFFMLLTSIATATGVFVLRVRKPDLIRPYKVWGYPFTTLIFVIAYTWIAVRVFLYNPQNALIGILIVLIGIPFFIYWKKKSMKNATGMSGMIKKQKELF
jgi:amino acid transporter